jgi:hypothetical protein
MEQAVVHELAVGTAGSVLLPRQILPEMGITQQGDYRLVALAVPRNVGGSGGAAGLVGFN